MSKKKGYTMVEVLVASGILAFAVMHSMGIISMMSGTLFSSTAEKSNRDDLSSTIYYLSREVQSADDIMISEGGKRLDIKRRGDEGYTLVYEIEEDYPTGKLSFSGRKLLDLKFSDSFFQKTDDSVSVTLAVLKNDTDINQVPKTVNLKLTPRGEAVISE